MTTIGQLRLDLEKGPNKYSRLNLQYHYDQKGSH